MFLKSFISISLFVCLIVFPGCQEKITTQPSTELTQNILSNKAQQTTKLSKVTYDDLKILSKDLALLLNQEGVREILEKSIKESSNVEQILEVSEFLHRKITLNNNGKAYSTTIFNELLKIDNDHDFIKALKNIDFGLIDIYFPSKVKRHEWNKNKELLVVPVIPKVIKKMDKVVAFNTKGEVVTVSTKNEPEIPALVVTLSEKRGHYTQDGQNVQQLRKVSGAYNVGLTHIFIKQDYEGWLMGDMEIYLKVKTKEGANGTWSPWSSNIYLGAVTSNHDKVFSSPGVSLASFSITDSYFKIEIWEEDDPVGGGADDFVADENYTQWRVGNAQSGFWLNWLGAISQFPYISDTSIRRDISTFDGTQGSSDYDSMCIHCY